MRKPWSLHSLHCSRVYIKPILTESVCRHSSLDNLYPHITLILSSRSIRLCSTWATTIANTLRASLCRPRIRQMTTWRWRMTPTLQTWPATKSTASLILKPPKSIWLTAHRLCYSRMLLSAGMKIRFYQMIPHCMLGLRSISATASSGKSSSTKKTWSLRKNLGRMQMTICRPRPS